MYSGKYNNSYNASFVGLNAVSPVNDLDYAYVEITTRTGKGPLQNYSGGFYAFKPLLPAYTKSFYTPKYHSREPSSETDLRSTIHWEPNVVTDINGQASLIFFTSDRKGRLTITTEGSNMNGLLGSNTSHIRVK